VKEIEYTPYLLIKQRVILEQIIYTVTGKSNGTTVDWCFVAWEPILLLLGPAMGIINSSELYLIVNQVILTQDSIKQEFRTTEYRSKCDNFQVRTIKEGDVDMLLSLRSFIGRVQ
jgi:hypothetical protein